MMKPISDLHDSAEISLSDILESGNPVAAENLQARLRGLIVMAQANATGAMAIATGNKSELGQGYCTLYGDMAGGYAPLGDLYKMEVYAMARAFNERLGFEAITESTMTKPPSAELAPNQKDEDSLPPYPLLDEILRLHIEGGLDATGICSQGHDPIIVNEVLTRLARNEHKRWQMPPAPRVSCRAFGQGWRQPLAARHDWRH
jgi:NAD+ synthase (glutamine-hydrolysing)